MSDGTTVEFDQGLNYCIRQIRLALKDDARHPKYIETVPKRGYRLLVPVTQEPSVVRQTVSPESLALRMDGSVGEDAAPSLLPPTTSGAEARTSKALAWCLAAALTAVLVWIGPWSGRASSALDAESEQLFVEAEHLNESWDAENVAAAVTRYNEVTRRAPRFAPAWAGLANADILMTYLGGDPIRSLEASEAHARRALEIDPSLSMAHAAIGHSAWHRWRWSEADREFQRALQIDPRSVGANQLSALYLASTGHHDEAIRNARRAVELAPVSGIHNYSLSQVYLQTGHYEAARQQAARTLAFDRHFSLAYLSSMRASAALEDWPEAWRAVEDGVRYDPEGSLGAWRAYLLARTGHLAEARALLRDDDGKASRSHMTTAHIATLVALGDTASAFVAFHDAVSAHLSSLVWLRTAPELEALRSDPRFAQLLGRMDWH